MRGQRNSVYYVSLWADSEKEASSEKTSMKTE